jgi:ectoine hydroxylase-related dioxygenase (phytanoyl-CoA dioxygenase family)
MLTADEVTQFQSDGFCGPFDLADSALVKPLLDTVLQDETFVPKTGMVSEKHLLGKNKGAPLLLPNAHLKNDMVMQVGRDPAIVERLSHCMGDAIWLRRSQFWRKPSGSHGVAWHQDTYRDIGLGDMGEISAWVALEDSHVDNGCVWLLRGSHKAGVVEPASVFSGQFLVRFFASDEVIVPKPLQHYEAVPMELRKGQFFLFNQLCFHASGPNPTGGARTGLAYRYISDPAVTTETLTRVGPMAQRLHRARKAAISAAE